jgi:hypothetical protein
MCKLRREVFTGGYTLISFSIYQQIPTKKRSRLLAISNATGYALFCPNKTLQQQNQQHAIIIPSCITLFSRLNVRRL